MSLLKRQLFFKALSLLCICSFFTSQVVLAGSSFYLSGSLMNLYLIHQSPFTKKFPFFSVQVFNPTLEFSKQDQRLYLLSDVVISLPNQAPIKGNFALDSSFTYDPISYKIALKDPRLSSFTLDVLNEKDHQILKLISPLLGPLFNQLVVYQLSSSDIKMLRKPPSSILIEDGGIRFYFD